MIKKSKRVSFLIIVIPILMLLIGSSYFAYTELQKYAKSVTFSQRFESLDHIKKIQQAIINEIMCAASTSEDDENTHVVCKAERAFTDNLLQQLTQNKQQESFLGKLIRLLPSKNQNQNTFALGVNLEQLDDVVKDIRYDIDTSKRIDIDLLINGKYYQKIINPTEKFIQSSIHEMTQNSDASRKNKALDIFQKLSSALHYTNLERILVMYYITTKQGISPRMLKRWDTFIASSETPEIENAEIVKHYFNIKLFKDSVKHIEDVRIDLLINREDGQYGVTKKEWIGSIQQKEKSLSDAMQLIVKKLLSSEEKNIKTQEMVLLSSFAVVLLSIIFTIYLARYYFRMREEDVVLANVISEVEKLSLHDGIDESDVPKMPKNLGNKKEVYSYLESILQLLHKKEKEAEEANKAKSQFLANMSHELRTPLNGIVGFTELLSRTKLDEDQQEFTSIIETSSGNLLSIIDDILDLSKIEADKIEVENISFNLFEKMETLIETFMARAEQNNITLGIFIDPNLEHQWIGDPTKITQILTNLIGNALKFTPPYGSINVYVKKVIDEAGRDLVEFSVEDTGIGIDDDAKQIIFEAFSQADSSTNRKFGGTGLGLTISNKMVNILGGALELESKRDVGSTFSFTIPLLKDTQVQNDETIDFKIKSVGLALPVRLIDRKIDSFLKEYVKTLKLDFKIYYYGDIFSENCSDKLPDVMIFYHHYARYDGELEKISSFTSSTILISTATLRERINSKIHHFSEIVYAPITFRKVQNMLSHIGDDTKKKILEEKSSDDLGYYSGMQALVAEDNPINQKLIKVLLEKLGLSVTLAHHGKEALTLRKENKYDIIFMDIQMPVMNGMEATQAILEYEKENNIKHIPIVALTANALTGDKEKYMEAGMDNYLSKPIDIKKLSILIGTYFTASDMNNISENIEEEQMFEETTLVVNTKEIEDIKKEHIDILLYISTPLTVKVYESMLSTLGYSIDIATNPNNFLDKLEEKDYDYALYEGKEFGEQQYLVCDIILDYATKPIMLVPKYSKDNECSRVLTFNADVEEVKERLIS